MFGSIFSKRHPKVGARPGTLVIPETSPPPRVRMIRFNNGGVQDSSLESNATDGLKSALDENFVTWIDVQGFGDKALLKKFGETFELHPLLLEDIINVPQRPKAEAYEDQLLVIVRMVHPLASGKSGLGAS